MMEGDTNPPGSLTAGTFTSTTLVSIGWGDFVLCLLQGKVFRWWQELLGGGEEGVISGEAQPLALQGYTVVTCSETCKNKLSNH